MGPQSRGRILRVKRGYNPNSSSIGSDIPTFLFSSSALVLLSAMALQVHSIIKAHFGRDNDGAAAKKSKGNDQ